jgi:hypothetical protein
MLTCLGSFPAFLIYPIDTRRVSFMGSFGFARLICLPPFPLLCLKNALLPKFLGRQGRLLNHSRRSPFYIPYRDLPAK